MFDYLFPWCAWVVFGFTLTFAIWVGFLRCFGCCVRLVCSFGSIGWLLFVVLDEVWGGIV